MNSYNPHDVIYALATAWAKSAIAVVRVSGEGCIKALSGAIEGKRDSDWGYSWVPVVGPMTGAALAAGLALLVF